VLNTLNYFLKNRIRNKKNRVESSKKNEIDDLRIRLLDNERNRIADLLHDNINPLLIALKCQLKLINLNDNRKLIESKLYEIYHLVNEIISKQNELIVNNGLNILSIEDFVLALKSFIHQIKTFEIILVCDYPINCFFKKNELNHIYSIVLELITNVVKYEKIDKLYLSMKSEDRMLIFCFKHDGIGMKKDIFLNEVAFGRGLPSIRKRLIELKGSIDFIKLDNQFKIVLEIPFHNEQGNKNWNR
jgi:two-component system sensor histidine kinase UhpB